MIAHQRPQPGHQRLDILFIRRTTAACLPGLGDFRIRQKTADVVDLRLAHIATGAH